MNIEKKIILRADASICDHPANKSTPGYPVIITPYTGTVPKAVNGAQNKETRQSSEWGAWGYNGWGPI